MLESAAKTGGELQARSGLARQLTIGGIAAWLIYLAADFWSHAVLLRVWWAETGSYWRPPEELFAFIPYAYAAFLIYCIGLTWLLLRLSPEPTLRRGAAAGTVLGLLTGVWFTLSAYSVFPMPAATLVLWPVAMTAESALAGAAAGWVLTGERTAKRLGLLFALWIAAVVAGILAQNLLPGPPGSP
jgi:hypothetical protein